MKIALGVTGGIAAYKAAEILRLLQDRGLKVQVIMTRAAQEFVRPLTFAALSGEKVITGMFARESGEPNVESAIEHIAVAEQIDALLVAPATADILAKFAHGVADDFLSTLFLATTAPVVVAPAMNVNMWNHAATQANLATLRSRGVRVVEPGSGYLACGMTGAGRLAANEAIVAAVLETLGVSQDFAGETVLITAGPTREAIDPVRYISNRSSGKMGYALAEAALRRGARVLLVSGPTALKPPDAAEVRTSARTCTSETATGRPSLVTTLVPARHGVCASAPSGCGPSERIGNASAAPIATTVEPSAPRMKRRRVSTPPRRRSLRRLLARGRRRERLTRLRVRLVGQEMMRPHDEAGAQRSEGECEQHALGLGLPAPPVHDGQADRGGRGAEEQQPDHRLRRRRARLARGHVRVPISRSTTSSAPNPSTMATAPSASGPACHSGRPPRSFGWSRSRTYATTSSSWRLVIAASPKAGIASGPT